MSDRLGNARWEEQSFVSEHYRYEPARFWLGRAEDAAGIGYQDDRHICLVSGSRGGKGTSIIVNNLCLYPGSCVVIDPKGENASITASRRGRGGRYCEGMGQAVHVLDPFNAAVVDDSYRSAFNPLDALNPASEESIDEAARLANALVVVKDDRADPFFDESARALVRGLILHVLTADDFEPQERTLLMVRDLLKRGEFRIAQRMKDLGAEDLDPPHQLLWRAMELNTAFGGVVAGDGTRFLSMMTNAGKTFESVLQTALVNTEFLDSPGMRRTLDHSDFKLSALKTARAGMTLYLSLPQRYMDTHYRWLRMMVALVTTEMEIVRGRPATGYPVLMVLDEFAGLKRMTAIENAVAQIAGFGVKLFFVLQSLEQLKYVYKDNWETFLSNAGLKIFFSIEDHFTRDYVSKLMGETEIIREMRSTNEGQSESESFAEGQSQSQSQSRSTTRGTSETFTDGTSQSRTAGTSRSTNRSQSEGENWSENRSRTHGTTESENWSKGTSSGSSYRRQQGFFGLFRTIDPNSETLSMGQNSSFGGSRGTSDSTSTGTSRGGSRGTSTGTTEGTSESATDGRSQSRATGTSHSETAGTSTTTGTSQTTTRGTGRSYGSGTSQTLHRRPLLRPEEFGKLFARIDDPQHPAYPGFGLVLVTGRDPFVVHRTHYFSDPFFIDTFTPHPDHDFTPAIETRITEARPLITALEAANDGKELAIAAWSIEPTALVEAGQPAVRIDEVPRDGRSVTIYVPYTGKSGRFARLPFVPDDQPLFSVKHYPAGEAVDPLKDLKQACADLLAPAPPRSRLLAGPQTGPLPWKLIAAAAAIVLLVAAIWLLVPSPGHKKRPHAARSLSGPAAEALFADLSRLSPGHLELDSTGAVLEYSFKGMEGRVYVAQLALGQVACDGEGCTIPCRSGDNNCVAVFDADGKRVGDANQLKVSGANPGRLRDDFVKLQDLIH